MISCLIVVYLQIMKNIIDAIIEIVNAHQYKLKKY